MKIRCTCGKPGHEPHMRPRLPAYVARRAVLNAAVREAKIALTAVKPGTIQHYADVAALHDAQGRLAQEHGR